MRKFKHKQTGTLVEQEFYNYRVLNSPTLCKLPKSIVENTNDWEEIIEEKKDYEIVQFYINSYLVPGTNYTYNPENKIHSVKRLSDGEIFSIGDAVKAEHEHTGTIAKFAIFPGDKLMVFYGGYNSLLESIQKWYMKSPLFTTEDGVVIFKGDYYNHVNLHSFEIDESHADNISGNLSKNMYKYFSTREAAEEYVLVNKPSFNIEEIFDYLFNDQGRIKYTCITSGLKEHLKNIVKKKNSKLQ